MNKMTKCRSCGKYEIKYKAVGNHNKPVFPELDEFIYRSAPWKWCILKNNWCRYVANHCDYIPANKQQLKKENILQE